jgi:ABC-type transport system involved in multi-copper enzyme maturation permease subunit
MLSHLVKKEILDNLLNQRFIWACVVSIVLIVSSLVVLTEYYKDEARDYRSRVTTQNHFIDDYGHWNRITWMGSALREPSRYLPFAVGIEREALQENFVSNPVPVLFSRLDFVAVVTIIMSLIAILFSYDAISGEREAGLLKLMLSTGVARSKILVGKFFGGTVSLLVPFSLGVFSGLLYFSLASEVQLQSVDFAVFLLLLLVSFVYIAAFYSLGLLFSSRSHDSSQALLKSLFAWVVLVLVIPNISPFLAAQLYRIPSWTKVQQDVSRITSLERDEILRQRSRALFNEQFSDLNKIKTLSRQELEAQMKSDPVLKARMAEWAKANDELMNEVNKIQQAQAKIILRDFDERSNYQESLAKIFASASPYSNFVFIATDLMESGINAGDHWDEQSSVYERNLSSFAEARYKSEKEKNPSFDVNDHIDMRGHPQFQYQPASLAERINLILVQTGIMILFCVLFFSGAFVSFLKYDVR